MATSNRKLCGVRWVKLHNNCEGAYNMLIISRQSHSILLWTEDIDQLTASLLNIHKALCSFPHLEVEARGSVQGHLWVHSKIQSSIGYKHKTLMWCVIQAEACLILSGRVSQGFCFCCCCLFVVPTN